MPELPEMEIYRSVLSRQIIGKQITGVEINREKSINLPIPMFVSQLQGLSITAINRRAKHLIFRLSSGKHLLLHLMLGGWMFLGDDSDSPDRTKQVILTFGEKKLFFIGLRLGYLHLLSTDELNEKFADLGPEPFDPAFHVEDFVVRLSHKRGTLKSVLVDQKFIAGIGNCYSDEICFEAQLRTSKKADELTIVQKRVLFHAIKPVLARAIEIGGYMDDPIYAGDVKTGQYNEHFLVYERENQPCRRCGTSIVKLEVSSRKTFICPNCQAE